MITHIGALIKKRRISLGMTQEDLARLSGIRQGEISQIERGAIQRPGWDKLNAISPHLKLSDTDIKRALGWVVVIGEGVKVPVLGRVPADTIRFTADHEGAGLMQEIEVTRWKIGDARNPFALEVSGDCFKGVGIHSGDVVIVEPAEGRRPRHQQIVVVRINSDVTMKRWVETDAGIELHDGDGATVHTIDPNNESNLEVIAFYVTYEPLAPR